LKTQRPVILYNQKPGIHLSLLRSTNSPPPCADSRPPARRPAPRTWRLRAVLPGGFAAAPGVSVRIPFVSPVADPLFAFERRIHGDTPAIRALRAARIAATGPTGPARTQRRPAPFAPLRPVSRTLVPASLKRLRRSGFAAGASRQRLRRGASRLADQSLSGSL